MSAQDEDALFELKNLLGWDAVLTYYDWDHHEEFSGKNLADAIDKLIQQRIAESLKAA